MENLGAHPAILHRILAVSIWGSTFSKQMEQKGHAAKLLVVYACHA